MKAMLCRGLCLLGLLGASASLMAQSTFVTFVQFSQQATTVNLQSFRGAPISSSVDTNIGSDGQMPAYSSSYLSTTVPTGDQFVNFLSFGAVTAATNSALLDINNPNLQGTNAFSLTVAANMQLPIGTTPLADGSFIVLRRAAIGAPFVSQATSYLFGSVIATPVNDVNGVIISNSAWSWLPEPYPSGGYIDSTSTNSQFYYSPNAGVVFATKAGPINVTWVTHQSWQAADLPSYTNLVGSIPGNGFPSYLTNADNSISELFTVSYVISPSPVKAPQHIYWTEGAYANLGHPIFVPAGRITAMNVIYNDSFPATVTTPVPNQGSSETLPTQTLWYDNQGSEIHAYNVSGRVFVEFDGAPNGDGSSQYLGFEIVDVEPSPPTVELTNNLGEILTPYRDPTLGSALAPSPLVSVLGNNFYYQNGSTYYADQLTTSANELQIYWLDAGVAGLQSPAVFDDYTLVWPSDPSQYSYYLRPAATTTEEASLTAVQLDSAEAPNIDYQDPLDQPRAFLTSSDEFYTWLTVVYPAQRALLRFNANGHVRFERVFSYLAQGLQNNAFLDQSVVTNLSAWDPVTSTLTNYAPGFNPPYVATATADVGDQINPPDGAATNSSGGDYWAGHINTDVGTSYDPFAYRDPFSSGFANANQGAIIPVNAIPGNNRLEVWWFRKNDANPAQGFQPVYWPSIIGDYTIQWPANAPAIVLAANKGSGPLDSLRAAGSIYYQNDPTQPGYNPNEEHALMLGGQAYALRDDLNVTNTASLALPFNGYSSAPFVLLSYNGSDGRPAMSVFSVQREDPAAGIYFDFIVPAGNQLQPPMPLPLMTSPVVFGTNYPGGFTNYDTEPQPPGNAGDLPIGWIASDSNGPYASYPSFTFQDRNHNFWVYRGLHAGLPPLAAGSYDTNSELFGPLPNATAVVNSNFVSFIHVSRPLDSVSIDMTDLPPGLDYDETGEAGLSIVGVPTAPGSYPITITLTDAADESTVKVPLLITVTNSGPLTALGPLVISSANQYSGQYNTYSNRTPELSQPPAPSNSFTMRFYYKTIPGFAWPALGNSQNWPPVGSIVPYLRPLNNGLFVGDPASSNTPSLDIVYRPVWPAAPTLALGQTLTTAVNDLAQIRGQDSVQVIYQQSIATNIRSARASVALFDPTVQKASSLAALVQTNGLPASVLTSSYNGLTYFPTLPPNLVSRVWFDPNTTNLYFKGQFVSDPVSGDYVMLNVLRGDDLTAVDQLCTNTDVAHKFWTNAMANLSTPEYTFTNSPRYVINTNLTVIRRAGDLVEVTNSDTAVDSYALSATGPGQGYITYIVANGLNPAYANDPISVYIARVAPPLFPGALVVVNNANASPFSQLITFQHTADLAGRTSQYFYDWRIEPPVNGQPPPLGTELNWQPLPQLNPGPVYTLGASGVQGLSDNYVSMRYGFLQTNVGVVSTNWSQWANPILAEGWISRVTQALDPIAGQTQNLYNNPANTTASLIQLAGARWNGAVPLNAASLTNSGLIQLYETVLDVGESLSINSGIDFGPANQALLTTAGYLNDLYMTLGNAAWANSLNPTISFGTDNQTYGAVATASFCFEGEVPTLLQQNLALLRGRDDSLSPGVDLPPVYNRLYWNYTYGLNAGQVIYALNYNITDQNGDGVVNAADAAVMFPQGHGDAYGHYLTALMEYYKLLMNQDFDWIPQAQTVLVLGSAVTVNYENETKFASAAAALARTGRQIFDLTWRQDYQPGTAGGWSYFATNYVGQYPYIDLAGNTQHITRDWGMDHWASRVGQGTYFNWVVGNSILPYSDPNPNDQGVQIVDRQTVQELQELPATAAALEADMDNANAGFTPLGLAQNAIPFDINPNQVTGSNPQTHFEQIYARAVQALNNAVTAFNAAQNVTQDLRQQQNSLTDLQASVNAQELAYNNQLIELYGTPYPEDIGPGGAYPDGYTGPDLVHYVYVDNVATNSYGGVLPDPTTNATFLVDTQSWPNNWYDQVYSSLSFIVPANSPKYTDYVAINIGPDGFSKPSGWVDERGTIGSIQTAIAAVNTAQDQFRIDVASATWDKDTLDQAILYMNAQNTANVNNVAMEQAITDLETTINNDNIGFGVANAVVASVASDFQDGLNYAEISILDLPDKEDGIAELIGAIASSGVQAVLQSIQLGLNGAYQNEILDDQQMIATNEYYAGVLNSIQSAAQLESKVQGDLIVINQAEAALNGAQANYQALVAQGLRIQQERETFRQHAAAQVQGFTVEDAAFLVFQNEDLERYTTLFNLAAEYAYMAANAYDYETGLLNTPAGLALINQIISSSALGIIQDGQPQVSGTDTGDPGLANALAEMNGDWESLKGRLGFNNPDGYGTIASLRSENYRLLPGASGDVQWQELLEQNLSPDLRADSDVVNNCLQIDDGSGQAVPGIELTFSTTITDGENLFGQVLAPDDHSFSSSSFATKIFAVGVCLDGYVGMDNPVGVTSPASSPNDPNALAATPYIYLIPCGADSMRSPPLGDTSTIRTWSVDDVAIPLPFNIGASDFSSQPFYTAGDSLSEPLFAVRKQQAFRPVSTTQAFNTSIYGAAGALQPSQYTNQRLIGRSVWNSKWKLIIPGRSLLADPNQGLARFIDSVKDIHLYFVTYSYSGN